ncbi:Crp/Fnr family transcriptional regulator [Chitinophaga cymbidii]|uniref:cAMP-binding protein n=1 Tax=Chitinophaga cymbidii TaxID=1096750 RepID=A0A512RQM5_9BACT|nr:Crp/Fnr family transcriptional regulator [Chitinophaga cymbidii]GEP98008.1 cAMP-binding protein [Chitinophaga cymbidii]
MEHLFSLKQSLLSIAPLPAEEWDAFSEAVITKNFRKGDYLCREGQVENYIYFLNKGATRHYFRKDGKEFTVDFHFEGEFVTAYYSFLTRKPSPINAEAIDDTEAFLIPHQYLHEFYDRHHMGERIGRRMAEYNYIRRLEREMALLSLTAEERYHQLVQRHPALVRQISVKHLSSYLGIQPESLSRIRKQYGKQ